MIDETTWHCNLIKQKTFVWSATVEGIRLHHGADSIPYTIPWQTFQEVFQYSKNLALQNNGVVAAGTSQDNPPAGSIGAWVITQQHLGITPRHLSFIGPIFGRMGFVSRRLNGNSILWNFI